jgi:hypothetical protein
MQSAEEPIAAAAPDGRTAWIMLLALGTAFSLGIVALGAVTYASFITLPPSGRALAVFTTAMFLGIALMQWITGAVASMAHAQHADAFTAVLLAIAALLAAGALAFALLPAPRPVTGRA